MKLAVAALATIVALTFVASAEADGEAGLVIDDGGRVETYCISFEGDSVRGDELLRLAGLDVNQFSGVVCAIDGTGCTHSGSFDSCTCQCKAGSSDCTYWSYFVQPYGESWRYSVLGFQSAVVRDGDLQAWRWGEGSPASAPPPAPATFEAVCGHPPGAVAKFTPLPASTVPPSVASPAPPLQTPTLAPTIAASPSAAAPATAESSTPLPPATQSAPATSTVAASPAPSPAAPATGSPGDGASNLVPFAIAAGGLLLAIALAATWRRRRGA